MPLRNWYELRGATRGALRSQSWTLTADSATIGPLCCPTVCTREIVHRGAFPMRNREGPGAAYPRAAAGASARITGLQSKSECEGRAPAAASPGDGAVAPSSGSFCGAPLGPDSPFGCQAMEGASQSPFLGREERGEGGGRKRSPGGRLGPAGGPGPGAAMAVAPRGRPAAHIPRPPSPWLGPGGGA